jgi:hypothetical protein
MDGGVICGNCENCLFLNFGPFIAFEIIQNKMEFNVNKMKGCKM